MYALSSLVETFLGIATRRGEVSEDLDQLLLAHIHPCFVALIISEAFRNSSRRCESFADGPRLRRVISRARGGRLGTSGTASGFLVLGLRAIHMSSHGVTPGAGRTFRGGLA